MFTVTESAEIVNSEASWTFDPNQDAGEERGVGTADWIEAQASYYRSLGSDLAELLADHLAELALTWRVVSHGQPISVETFRGRCEILEEWRHEVDYGEEAA